VENYDGSFFSQYSANDMVIPPDKCYNLIIILRQPLKKFTILYWAKMGLWPSGSGPS